MKKHFYFLKVYNELRRAKTFETIRVKTHLRMISKKVNYNITRYYHFINPIGAGGGTMCPHFFQKAISPKWSGGPKFRDFS